MQSKKSEDFYKRLKKELSNSTLWPADYLYKFIVPSKKDKIEAIHNVFNDTGAVIQTKQSSKGTYTSVSVTVNLKNPDAVIAYYKEVGKIEGVISL